MRGLRKKYTYYYCICNTCSWETETTSRSIAKTRCKKHERSKKNHKCIASKINGAVINNW